jgi:phage shock protein PspC (stress-responsive transcriptional regulator)
MVMRARLRRRTEHRLVSGVAGGIADRLNAPVGFVRLLLVCASIPATWMIWFYGAATLLIPAHGRDRPDWDNAVGLARFGLIVALPLPYTVIVDEPFGGPAGWWVAYLALIGAGALALLGADYWRGHARTPAEARSAVIAAIPVAICGVALAAAMLLAPDVRWERWLPVAAVVGGGALALGAHRGRVAGLIAPAIVTLALTGVVVAADARLEGGLGDSRMTPTAQGAQQIVARRAIGDLALDLRRVATPGSAVTVDASVGLGTLRIRVPAGARVELDARVGQGTLEPLYDAGPDRMQGFDQRVVRTYLPTRHPRASGAPRIRLSADVGLGSLEIERHPGFLEGRS